MLIFYQNILSGERICSTRSNWRSPGSSKMILWVLFVSLPSQKLLFFNNMYTSPPLREFDFSKKQRSPSNQNHFLLPMLCSWIQNLSNDYTHWNWIAERSSSYSVRRRFWVFSFGWKTLGNVKKSSSEPQIVAPLTSNTSLKNVCLFVMNLSAILPGRLNVPERAQTEKWLADSNEKAQQFQRSPMRLI